MPDNDPLLDIYLNNKPQGAEEDDYRYPLEQSSDEEQPIDIGLFRSNEYAALKQQQQARGAGRMHIEEQERQLQTKKKMKNTYASKIAKLIHDEGRIEPSSAMLEQGASNSSSGGNTNMDNLRKGQHQAIKEDKLLKNRLSAQKSRKIKKQYMEILEERVRNLEAELLEAKRINERNAELIKKYCHNQTIIQGYIVTKQQVFDKMEKLIESKGQLDEAEINMQIDSLRYRFGATGKQRVSLIDYYLRQICDLMIPDVHKYMLYSAEFAVDIFSQEKEENPSELFTVIGLPQKQRTKISSMFRDTLLQERQGISSLLNELFQVKVKLEQQIRSIENTFDEIRKLIPPVSLSRFLLCLEKNKYRKDAAKVWSFWESVVKEHMDKSTEIIRKQIKKTTNEG